MGVGGEKASIFSHDGFAYKNRKSTSTEIASEIKQSCFNLPAGAFIEVVPRELRVMKNTVVPEWRPASLAWSQSCDPLSSGEHSGFTYEHTLSLMFSPAEVKRSPVNHHHHFLVGLSRAAVNQRSSQDNNCRWRGLPREMIGTPEPHCWWWTEDGMSMRISKCA